MEVKIIGSEIKNEEDFHQQISNLLNFPEFYGKNLDALRDYLTGFIDPNVKVIWVDFDISKENLGPRANAILDVLKDAQQELDGFTVEVL